MAEANREDIEKLEALFSANPGGRVFTHLAEAYRKAGELDRALEVLHEGLQRHPEYSSAHVVLGRVLWDQGEHEEAARGFERVLALDPQNYVALRALADLAHASGNNGEALQRYREILARDPGNDEIRQIVASLEAAPAGTAEAAAGSAPAPVTVTLDGPEIEGALEPPEVEPLEIEATVRAEVEPPAAEELDPISDEARATPEATSPDAEPLAGLEPAPSDEAVAPEAPLDERPAEAPLDEWPAEEPLDARPAEAPLDEWPAEEPLDERPAEAPLDERPAEEPLDERPAEAPLDERPAERVADDLPWIGAPEAPVEPATSTGWRVADEPDWAAHASAQAPEASDTQADGVEAPETDPEAVDVPEVAEVAEEAGVAEAAGVADHAETEDEPLPMLAGWDAADEDEAIEVITETMGDVYAAQALFDRAAEVYALLLADRPGDERLGAKLETARAQAAAAAADPGTAPAAEAEPPLETTARSAEPAWPAELMLTLAELVDESEPVQETEAAQEAEPWPDAEPVQEAVVAQEAEPWPDAEPVQEADVAQESAAVADAGGAAEAEDEDEAAGRLEHVESAWTGSAGATATGPSPYDWAEEPAEPAQGGGIHDYFRSLLGWRPSAEGVTVAEPAGQAAPTEDVPGLVAEADAAEPTGAPDEFDLLFGAESASEEPVGPVGAEGDGEGEAMSDRPAASYDAAEMFEEQGESEGQAGEDAVEEDEDLEMFRSWLQSLKR